MSKVIGLWCTVKQNGVVSMYFEKLNVMSIFLNPAKESIWLFVRAKNESYAIRSTIQGKARMCSLKAVQRLSGSMLTLNTTSDQCYTVGILLKLM